MFNGQDIGAHSTVATRGRYRGTLTEEHAEVRQQALLSRRELAVALLLSGQSEMPFLILYKNTVL